MKQKVMHLMRRGAITCGEDAGVGEIAQIMVINKIRYCVVLNLDNEVDGIIFSKNIVQSFNRDIDKLKAKDILVPYTVTITPQTILKDAIELMRKEKIEYLIVVSDQPSSRAVIGILHAEDIVEQMASAL